MDILGIDWLTDPDALLLQIREFALPRLGMSAGFLLAATVLHRAGGWLLRRLEKTWVARTDTEIDDAVFRAARRTVLISVWFWVGWRISLLWGLSGTARAVVGAWIVALSLPAAGLASDALEIVEQRVGRGAIVPLDQTALPLLNKVVRFLLVALGVLVALEYLGVDVTPLLAGAGVAGLAVSLAAKDTLSNLIAGILLILDRPFRVGDRIELWNAPGETASWGDVIEVGLRATKIRNPDNLVVVIPNNEIMRRDIVNYTASGSHIRLRVPFGIAYDADVERAKALILESAREVTGVKEDTEPVVIVRNFGESAVNLELRVWIHDARRRRAIGDEITGRVKSAFDRHGIEIPYPKRDLYLKESPARPRAERDGTSDASPPVKRPAETAPAEGTPGD